MIYCYSTYYKKKSKTKGKIPKRAAKNDHNLPMYMLRRSESEPNTLWPINGSLGFKGKNVYQQISYPQWLRSRIVMLYQRVS